MSQTATRQPISKKNRTRGQGYEGPAGVPKVKRTLGRPTEFMPDRVLEARGMAAAGMTIAEIATHFDVSRETMYAWARRYPDFSDALKVGRDACDDRVEATLYERASAGENTAMIFWLKNRRPQVWRDKQELDLNGSLQIEDSTSRDIALAMIGLLQRAGDDAESLPVTIEHETAPMVQPVPERASGPQERRRRAFE